jgi:hypothetical protein
VIYCYVVPSVKIGFAVGREYQPSLGEFGDERFLFSAAFTTPISAGRIAESRVAFGDS